MHPDCGDRDREYIVLDSSVSAATVQCTTRTRASFETADGEEVTFERPGRPFRISARASVVRLE
jgi:hypothetical protein